jgi:modification methylase
MNAVERIEAAVGRITDNKRGAVQELLSINQYYRTHVWPAPFDLTTHKITTGDARDLSWIPNKSVHLVVTSPPYWNLKKYDSSVAQLGDIEGYDAFLCELDKFISECARVLVPGGRICCVVGDVCIPRKKAGRHYVMPLHADLQTRARRFGLDNLTPILWFKIANGATEATGNGSGFYGKPFQPGAIIKNDFEYILFFRKGGEYRSPSPIQKSLSMLDRTEMGKWLRTSWSDINGQSTRKGHPAPYPEELAIRLIRMFSFAGDTVLDPFAGTGTTAVASIACGRNSISVDSEPRYVDMTRNRVSQRAAQPRNTGAVHARILT